MVSIGSIYYLLPRLFGKPEMFSVKLITVHFWVATIGVVLYIASMWIAGVMQGLMWRAVNLDGTLTYSFVESVKASYPFWAIRFLGGVLFLRIEVFQRTSGEDFALGFLKFAQGGANDFAGVIVAARVDQLPDETFPMSGECDVHSC